MSVVKNFLSAGMTGKLDNLVFCNRNGKTYLRTEPLVRHNPKTPAQQRVRDRFAAVVRFYQGVAETPLRKVWKYYGRWKSKNGYVCFTSINIKNFDETGQLADYPNLCLAAGGLSPADFLPLEEVGKNRYRVSWKKQEYSRNCRADDLLKVAVIYGEDPFAPLLLEGVRAYRSNRSCEIELPREGEVHLYFFFSSMDEDEFSENVHILLLQEG